MDIRFNLQRLCAQLIASTAKFATLVDFELITSYILAVTSGKTRK